MYIFRLKIHAHRRYVKKPSAGTQVSTGANKKRFINKTYIYRFLKQRSFASSRGTHSKTGKNTMKPLIRILSLWLAALCFGACTDDDLIDGTPTPEPETGIVIRLSAGDLEQTRTELTSQANLHNVKEVYALLYQGHGDDATFYACDKLEWNPKDSTDNTGVQEQRKEFLLPQSKNLAKGAYTVLCVGLDDESGETYNLPEAIQKEGSTLKDAKATLVGGKTKEDIAKSELFAGWNQFHFAPDSLNIVEVEMKRRVAGVLCYLTDIPYNITDNGTKRVTKVYLTLYKNQNNSIGLCRKEIEGNGYPDDFGERIESITMDETTIGNENRVVLMEFDLEDYGPQEDKNLYEITPPVNSNVEQLPNTLLQGVYMIPIDNTTDKNTLQIELWGKTVESADEQPADGVAEEFIRSFPAINDDIDLDKNEESGESTPSYTYPIRPNIIYHIGTKPSNDDTTGDTPESLAGTKVNIVAEEWTDQEIHVEFPSVPIMATMELLGYNESYIFDCIGVKAKLEITNSVMNNPWELDAAGDGVYFLKGSTYSQEYASTEDEYNSKTPVEVNIVIPDYAVENDYNKIALEEDIRTTNIILTTKTSSGDVTYTIPIKQYNAIIVDMGKEEGLRGFSRFDYGVERSANGTPSKGIQIGWGYWSSVPSQIYGHGANNSSETNGLTNYTEAKNGGAADKGFVGSAIQVCAKNGCTIDDSGYLVETEATWYLPSWSELEEFLGKFYTNGNVQSNEYYWSSFAKRGSHNLTWAYKVSPVGVVKDNDANRENTYYARQCCNNVKTKNQ